jgi:AcrR family transcriptional regulator
MSGLISGKRAATVGGVGRSRPYDVAKRQEVSDMARGRCLEAARKLLGEGGATELKMEEVARRAGVTRQTLYNQFGSRGMLVEAVFDELARAGGMEGMAGAMQQRDPEVRLREMVMVFARFWSEDRRAMRRVRALAATDAVLQRAVAAREERRRMACRRVVAGFGGGDDVAADVLFGLTSFEFFDTVAGETRMPLLVADVVLRMARAALGVG